MAITKVFAIRIDFKQTVRYAVNEQKTSLDGMIDYAVNPDKTEQRLFESCLNCSSVENASRDMERTKRRYNKTGGVQGYHIIQSFKPGELTPEQTHTIGVEFAKRLFGERFEVVIGTHLDKHHLHNHIAVNSVSFLDGKKLRCKPTFRRYRKFPMNCAGSMDYPSSSRKAKAKAIRNGRRSNPDSRPFANRYDGILTVLSSSR